ncbi:hypothetical protein [Acanthopleuribacter pedis]|uniref:Uncharacterized protein n=1 Tax=Acanthopleuribacter pedis TaxID=442870 RepID=A0A8J7QAQ6_9BACT|nr:hypothetical protein [Acanthopleuribacter pedis]MBO1322882.1 hypothetical protein [Acanthopleuribacter pedis]
MKKILGFLRDERWKGFLAGAGTVSDAATKGAAVVAVFEPFVGIPLTIATHVVSCSAKGLKVGCDSLKDDALLEERFAAAYSLILLKAFWGAVAEVIDKNQFPSSDEAKHRDHVLDAMELKAEAAYLLNYGEFSQAPVYKLLEKQLAVLLVGSDLSDDPVALGEALALIRKKTATTFNLLAAEQSEWVHRFLTTCSVHRIEGKTDAVLEGVTVVRRSVTDVKHHLATLTREVRDGFAGRRGATATAAATDGVAGPLDERLAQLFRTDAGRPGGDALAIAYAVTHELLLTVAAPVLGEDGGALPDLVAQFERADGREPRRVGLSLAWSGGGIVLLRLAEPVTFAREDHTHWLLPGENAVAERLDVAAFTPGDAGARVLLKSQLSKGAGAVAGHLVLPKSAPFTAADWARFSGAPCFAGNRLLGLLRAGADFDGKLATDAAQDITDLIQQGIYSEENLMIPLDPLLMDTDFCHKVSLEPGNRMGPHHQVLTSPFSQDSPRRRANREHLHEQLSSLNEATRQHLVATIQGLFAAEDAPARPGGQPLSADPDVLGDGLLAMFPPDALAACKRTIVWQDSSETSLSRQKAPWQGVLQCLLLHDLSDDWARLLDHLLTHDPAKAVPRAARAQSEPRRQIYLLKAALLHAAKNNIDLKLMLTQTKDKGVVAKVVNGITLSHVTSEAVGIVDKNLPQHKALDQLLFQLRSMVKPEDSYEDRAFWYVKEEMEAEDYTIAAGAFAEIAKDLKRDQRLVPFILFDLATEVFDFNGLCMLKKMLPMVPIYQDDGLLHRNPVLKTNPGSMADRIVEFLAALKPKEQRRESAHS